MTQETQVCSFALSLAQSRLAAEFLLVQRFFHFDQLPVQLIIFFDQAFIFVLQGQLCLGVERGLLGEYRVLVFDLLKGFGRFKQFIQEAFDECARLQIYKAEGSNPGRSAAGDLLKGCA